MMTKYRIARRHALTSGAVATMLSRMNIGSVGAAGVSGCLLVTASAFAAPPPGVDMTLATMVSQLERARH
jgi:hypothetical protein